MSAPVRFEPSPVRCLTLVMDVDGEEREVSVPLIQSLPLPVVRELTAARDSVERGNLMFDVLGRYLGEGVVDGLSYQDMVRIGELWKEASEVDVGESAGRADS